MFTYNERDLHRMPTPARSHLPMKEYIAASGILDDEVNATLNNDADIALLRLPAPSLRGTFAKAYGLLAKLVSQIGWDELLKCRSQVFVMEEEYRMQKAHDPSSPTVDSESTMINGNGNGIIGGGETRIENVEEEEKEGFGPLSLEGDDDEDADDNASTKAIPKVVKSASSSPSSTSSSPTIPTIKVSTDSDGERERRAVADYESSNTSGMAAEVPGLEKPKVAVQGEEDQGAPKLEELSESSNSASGPSGSFSNKRLCERWLDNLFMVLYEVSNL